MMPPTMILAPGAAIVAGTSLMVLTSRRAGASWAGALHYLGRCLQWSGAFWLVHVLSARPLW